MWSMSVSQSPTGEPGTAVARNIEIETLQRQAQEAFEHYINVVRRMQKLEREMKRRSSTPDSRGQN